MVGALALQHPFGMEIEAVLFILAATLVIGSVCGIRAAFQIGTLTRRLATLELQLAGSHGRPRDHAFRQAVVNTPPVAPSPPPVVAPTAAELPIAPPPVTPAFAPPQSPPPPSISAPQVAPPPVLASTVAELPIAPLPVARSAFAAPQFPPPPVASTASLSPRTVAASKPVASADTTQTAADWWRAFELRAGTRWITWLGAAALVIGAALFLKLAIDEGWLGPVARLSLGALAGVALLVGGRFAHRAEMRPLAQGLFGAGLGVFYVVTYIAFSTHGLIARELAFGAMVGITVAGGALALRHDAQAVAALALIGGLITPVAVSSGDGGREALCLYLVVLDLGALAIAFVRGWRAIELTALVGTWILFGGWLEANHTAASWRPELAWLAIFHVLFLGMPYVLRRWRGPERELIPDERFFLATAGGLVTFVMAAVIVDGGQMRLGAIALVMAAGYAAIASIADARGGVHRGFILAAVSLVTIAMPLVLTGPGITIGWAIEAPLVLALGMHWRQIATRFAGLGILGCAVLHVAVLYAEREQVTPFVNAEYGAALVVAVAAGVFAVLHRRSAPQDRWFGIVTALGGAALALIVTHVELASVSLHLRPLLWAGGATAAIVIAIRSRSGWAFAAATGFAAMAGMLVLEGYGRREVNELARVGTATITLSVTAALAMALRRCGEVTNSLAAWIVTLAGFGLVIGAEAGAQHHALLSIAWACYAAALLAIGFVRRNRPLRLGGLGLLGLVAAKLVLHDLADAAPLHRVLSFLIVGVLMIAASFAYHRLERRA
ncbi:MAG TPA: DUF2339 domain-containing protein [Kofleriaceae bacterium]